MITVVLNGYKRPNQLSEQITALNSGTVKPAEIMCWYNYAGDDVETNYEIGTEIPVAYNNHNYGVWARFYYAMNASNPYVCVFDDDTIPGSRWLENCMETMNTHEGLLGTVGIKYLLPSEPTDPRCSYYERFIRFGWVPGGQCDVPIEVDLVGHAWFFKREWLSIFTRELPNPRFSTCGEDMHFSYMLQKYAGIKTYVPPHPYGKEEMWGSIRGAEYGDDSVSLWNSNQPSPDGTSFKVLMNEFFVEQRNKGWRLLNE